jgi:hypothetical protein
MDSGETLPFAASQVPAAREAGRVSFGGFHSLIHLRLT